MDTQPNNELCAILQHYDLGELTDYEKDMRGFCNTSFTIETIKDGKTIKNFFRRYKQSIKEEELLFEHSVINHLVDNHSLPVAKIYKTRQGKSYVHIYENEMDKQGTFYAIFEFLQGNDKYTWVDPQCTDKEVISSAQTLAQLHEATCDLQPEGKRAELKILELLAQIKDYLIDCPNKDKHTIFDAYLAENLSLLIQNLQYTLDNLTEPEAIQMPQCIIHCDFHPGNLKYENETATGLFDFDWSKIDFRLFDIALALWYFFASWKDEDDGALKLTPLALFYNTYQDYLAKSGTIGPLSPVEQHYLPWMINASNLYVLNWTLLDFYNKDVNPQEYIPFLRHSVNFMKWFEDQTNVNQLIKTLKIS